MQDSIPAVTKPPPTPWATQGQRHPYGQRGGKFKSSTVPGGRRVEIVKVSIRAKASENKQKMASNQTCISIRIQFNHSRPFNWNLIE